jgi:hypothetical protein
VIDEKQQLIDDADTINNFLENESVRRVFRAYDYHLFTVWKQAATPAEREAINAKASAFDGIAVALRAVVDSGKRETHDLDPDNATDLVL